MAYKSDEDRKAYHRRWYEKNKTTRREQIKKNKKQRFNFNKRLVDRYKKFCGCLVCGYNKCASAIDFHHIYEHEKEISIAAALPNRSTKSIKEEIRKCVVLCSRCHRELHAGFIDLPPKHLK